MHLWMIQNFAVNRSPYNRSKPFPHFHLAFICDFGGGLGIHPKLQHSTLASSLLATPLEVRCKALKLYIVVWSCFKKSLFIFVHVISLTDEIPEHRKEAEEVWAKVGEQFTMENETDLKDKIDYLQETLEHYPSNSM